MASNNFGFDPPSQPREPSRTRRMDLYAQPGSERELSRGGDYSRTPGQGDSRRRVPVPQLTGLPRPNVREQPGSRPRPEAQRAASSSASLGTRSGTKPAGSKPVQLRGKSSRNVLRRKPSSIQPVETTAPPSEPLVTTAPAPTGEMIRAAPRRPSVDSPSRSVEAYNEIFRRDDPRASPAFKGSHQIIPELDRYRSRPEHHGNSSRMMEAPPKISTQDLPPPSHNGIVTPVYSGGSSHHRYSGYSGSGYSASPSTRFSESPGPGGSYSRDTTPTSMSSQSPGIFLPLKTTTPRIRQGSLPNTNRPPVSTSGRMRSGSFTDMERTTSPIDSSGLSVVRESLTSSSSNSTVKGEGKGKDREEEKKKKKRLSPMPPSPPPRKSSQKSKKPSPGDFDSPSKPSQTPARPMMGSPAESDSPSKLTRPTMSKPESSPAKLTRPQAKRMPPMRPSREGAPDLQNQFIESVNVIHSNLAGISLSPEARRNPTPSPLQIQTSFRPIGSRIPSRNASPGPLSPLSREATPAPAGLGIIPDLRPRQATSSRGTTPSPSQSSKPRFGLFGRRTKTEPAVESKEKAPRKGPAAGTGHEGYGKYALRGRSSSAGGLGRQERSFSIASSSQESIASLPATFDPFLLHRMSPVIIAGGGEIIENRNSGSGSFQAGSFTSPQLRRPSVDSRGSSRTNLSNEAQRNTLWPSAMPNEPTRRISGIAPPKGRRPSDSSDDGFSQDNLAFRRSVQRLGHTASALGLPRPINMSNTGMSSSVTSLDASLMSDDSRLSNGIEIRGRKGQLKKPRKLEKRPKSPTKWNFFHRSKPADKTATSALTVKVGKAPPKAVPHYAMLDSSDEQQDVDPADLEEFLRDAHTVELSNEELDALQFGTDRENMRRNEGLQIIMPPAESITAPAMFSSPEPMATPELVQRELHLVKETAPVRPSRLPQVGRIPKVISARPETTSPKSFSRPFARLSVAHPQQLLVADKQSVALGQSPPKSSTDPVNAIRQGVEDSKTESSGSHHDFLSFSPRKNSEATTSSSGGSSVPIATAAVPQPDVEFEDEVWDEYDDLIENDDTMKAPVSATSSHGVPFQYESYETRQLRKSRMRAKESPTLAEFDPERSSNVTSSSVYSQEMSAKLKEAVNTLPTPTTPLSFTDFFSGYGDRNNSVLATINRPRRSSHSGSRKSNSSDSRTLSGLISVEEQENPSPRSQVNLRVGSMTVSKWLTFGHVLFSPAREGLGRSAKGSTQTHSILVIDGLGNDDWSFYAAETYPSATFYNLSPTRSIPSNLSPNPNSTTALPSSPPNHRQIQHLSPSTRFPFPASFFDIVVFRFPCAASLATYRNIISESKRVLKPGGYLEMAILDLDMLNMGNRARRAVRGLKVKMQVVDKEMVLGSASDVVMKLVAGRGFTDVKSCKVGVPVASTVASPPTSSASTHPTSTSGTASTITNTSGTTSSRDKVREKAALKAHAKTKSLTHEPSLADLLKTDSPSSDEGITKMVARVGRFWYTRCYESLVLPNNAASAGGMSPYPGGEKVEKVEERSMWYADGGRLLSECEKRNASFKLVVAYAQKPVSSGSGSREGTP